MKKVQKHASRLRLFRAPKEHLYGFYEQFFEIDFIHDLIIINEVVD